MAYFISLYGVKDIILKSTHKPMKLLHLNFIKNINNTKSENMYTPRKGYMHMFCFHENDHIVNYLKEIGIHTDTTASLIHCNMDNVKPCDWDFIQTSEI